VKKTLEPEYLLIIDSSGTELKLSKKDVCYKKVSNPSKSNDLSKLSEIDESNILHCLVSRYAEGECFTYAGPNLVCIGPNFELAKLQPLVARPNGALQSTITTEYGAAQPPHPRAMADRAYRLMAAEGEDQAVIVHGESGEARSEAMREVLQAMRELSSPQPGAVRRIFDHIEQVSPDTLLLLLCEHLHAEPAE
jgi:myosin heavy subunit